MDGGVLEEGRGEDLGRFEDGDDDAMVMVDGGVWRLLVPPGIRRKAPVTLEATDMFPAHEVRRRQ